MNHSPSSTELLSRCHQWRWHLESSELPSPLSRLSALSMFPHGPIHLLIHVLTERHLYPQLYRKKNTWILLIFQKNSRSRMGLFWTIDDFLKSLWSPGQVAQLVGGLSHTPKCYRLDSWSGHLPRLWLRSPVGAHTAGSWSLFLSYINVPLSLPASSLSKIKHILGWGLKKIFFTLHFCNSNDILYAPSAGFLRSVLWCIIL